MLQQQKPNDYVIATGEAHSVRDFVGSCRGWPRLAASRRGRSPLFPADARRAARLKARHSRLGAAGSLRKVDNNPTLRTTSTSRGERRP